MLEFALGYARRGWPVFPVHSVRKGRCSCPDVECRNPAKHPRVLHGVKEATIDEKKVTEWWTLWPDANIGIALGEKAGMFALDVDPRHDGNESLFDLERQYSKLPPTPRAITGSNGYHYFLKPKRFPVKNKVGIAPGLDIRGDGGYVVAAPSIHILGKKYAWECEFEPESIGIADAPDWLDQFLYEKAKKTSGKIKEGGRNRKLFEIGCALRGKGATEDDIFGELIKMNAQCVPPLDEDELQNIAKKAAKYEPEVEEVTEEEVKKKSQDVPPIKVADDFISQLNLTLRYHREEFYEYEKIHYTKLPDSDLRARLMDWMSDQPKLKAHVGKVKCSQALEAMKRAPQFIPSHLDIPAIKGGPARHLIPMQNGIFDIKAFQDNHDPFLLPHTPDFFCTYSLPYSFDMGAECPTYDRIAKDIFGNEDLQRIWEEIMGVHLYCPAKLEKFFILYGEGGNGKTLLLTILQCLLGPDNVSNVTLESFANDSFLMYETVGKLANIIPELPEMDKANEGIIKAFATRELMTFDRKFKHPVKTRPTAFLTMATNTKPRFQDKSDGIWRRMMLFTLTNQVTEEKQDRRLIDPEFWEKSGELSGIFNRAVAGLMRVIERGYLEETEAMKADKREYRIELNNVAQFIEHALEGEILIFDSFSRTPTKPVYESYKKMVTDNGGRPLGAQAFANQMRIEAKKRGYGLEVSKKNERVNNYCGKWWVGMRILPHVVEGSGELY